MGAIDTLVVLYVISLQSHSFCFFIDCVRKNWRAALALLLSVPPNLPGLINSINPKIDVGGGVFVFDVAWMFGVSFLHTLTIQPY